MVIAIPSQRNEFRQAAGRMQAPMMETIFFPGICILRKTRKLKCP